MPSKPMRKVPTPYRRTGNKYKAKFTLPGKIRIEVDLKSTDFNSACKNAEYIYNNYFDYFKINQEITLFDLINSYCSPDLNPKLLDSKETGKCYKPSTIRFMTNTAKNNKKLLSAKGKAFMNCDIKNLSRIDIIAIRKIIFNAFGRTRKSQMMFDQIKQYINFAFQTGKINSNPSDRIPSITYTPIVKPSIHPNLITLVINSKHFFPSTLAWAYFTIAATTGMRRSEIMGMNFEKIIHKENQYYYLIDQQWEQYSKGYVLPKMNKIRQIPLANITMIAIKTIGIKPKGRLFDKKWSWVDIIFQQLRLILIAQYPDMEKIKKLSSHVLRHSINTNLIIAGTDKDLIQKYLGWSREREYSTQVLYTHYGARDLIPVSKMIDKIYSSKS
ncbi:MAG: tyrosine-type recombinase/integrase [Sphaerochaeta sp.]